MGYLVASLLLAAFAAGPATSGSLRFAPPATLEPGQMVEVTVAGNALSGVRVVVQGR